MDEQILVVLRNLMELMAAKLVQSGIDPNEIMSIDLAFPFYKQDEVFEPGMVRQEKDTGRLYRCAIGYDGKVQPDWNLHTPSLWFPYHGKDTRHAYLFVHPTCAEDIYKVGEMMTYTDARIYRAKRDTSYSPDEYMQDWEVVDEN